MHEPKRRKGILATIETNRLTTFESLASQEGCSRSTIRKIAAEDGLQRHILRHAPPITDCTRVKRLQWVGDNMQRDWRTVLWTDEVPLTIGKDPRRHWVTRRVSGCYADPVIRPDVQLLRLAIVAEGGELIGKEGPASKVLSGTYENVAEVGTGRVALSMQRLRQGGILRNDFNDFNLESLRLSLSDL